MSDITNLAAYISQWGGRDLLQIDLGLIQVPDWQGFPVWHYRYHKADPNGLTKQGDIALLNPSDQQIARWTYAATIAVLGGYSEAFAKRIVDECGEASGFQFPVRGVHWEDMATPYTAYTFFDGVTVRLKEWNPSWPTRALTEHELDYALHAGIEDVEEAMKYARIQSTTRQEYLANGGLLPTQGKEWLATVRKCYQAAWNSDHNELLTAKARSLQ